MCARFVCSDEEGEGLIEPPKVRSSNYTPAEDILLCKTWCNVSMDATVGTDQNRDTYWDRMKVYFVKRNKSGNERTVRSLRSRWSTISTECQKWAGILAGIDKANPSGTNAQDKVSCSNMAPNMVHCAYLCMNLCSWFIVPIPCSTTWLKTCIEAPGRRTRKAVSSQGSCSNTTIAKELQNEKKW